MASTGSTINELQTGMDVEISSCGSGWGTILVLKCKDIGEHHSTSDG